MNSLRQVIRRHSASFPDLKRETENLLDSYNDVLADVHRDIIEFMGGMYTRGRDEGIRVKSLRVYSDGSPNTVMIDAEWAGSHPNTLRARLRELAAHLGVSNPDRTWWGSNYRSRISVGYSDAPSSGSSSLAKWRREGDRMYDYLQNLFSNVDRLTPEEFGITGLYIVPSENPNAYRITVYTETEHNDPYVTDVFLDFMEEHANLSRSGLIFSNGAGASWEWKR